MNEQAGMKNPFPSTQRPSVSRIVIYRIAGPTEAHPDDSVVEEPAIIRGVNADGTVNVYVFDGETGRKSAVPEDDGAGGDEHPRPGTWHWPPRV